MSFRNIEFRSGGNALGLGGIILGIYVGYLLEGTYPWLQWGTGAAVGIFCVMWFIDWSSGRGLSLFSFLLDLMVGASFFFAVGGTAFVSSLYDRTGNGLVWVLVPCVIAASGGVLWLGIRYLKKWRTPDGGNHSKGLLG